MMLDSFFELQHLYLIRFRVLSHSATMLFLYWPVPGRFDCGISKLLASSGLNSCLS